MTWLTRLLRALAAGIDAFGKAFREAPEVLVSAGGAQSEPDQLEQARALAADMKLRRTLHDALHRYSPTEPPGQC